MIDAGNMWCGTFFSRWVTCDPHRVAPCPACTHELRYRRGLCIGFALQHEHRRPRGLP